MTTTNYPGSDKRSDERVRVNRTVEIQNTLTPMSRPYHAKLLDISYCGLAFVGAVAYPQGTELTLAFTLPDYEACHALSIKAKVVRSQQVQNQFLNGLIFPSLTAHENLVIRAFINFHRRFQA